eukprot:scaffold215314_cov28-Attheya_sp.AAC.3
MSGESSRKRQLEQDRLENDFNYQEDILDDEEDDIEIPELIDRSVSDEDSDSDAEEDEFDLIPVKFYDAEGKEMNKPRVTIAK